MDRLTAGLAAVLLAVLEQHGHGPAADHKTLELGLHVRNYLGMAHSGLALPDPATGWSEPPWI